VPLYRPSELFSFLKDLEIMPSKRLSQSFLIDGNVIQKIVMLSDVREGDSVFEIGSGPGVLTEALLNKGAFVVAVERDAALAKALYRLQTKDQRLTVIEGDILQIDLSEIIKRSVKVVGNLPYHIAVAIITKCLILQEKIISTTVMVQKEVALKFLAKPSCKDYGSITVFINFYSQPSYGFSVPPTCFYPKPQIQSAVVRFVPKDRPPIDENFFFTIVRGAFGKRRKMIRTSLKSIFPINKIDNALNALGKGFFVRPEELSLDDFLFFVQQLESKDLFLSL
jgi:16S rRNA (adenine1518-N6/adenine1519-N6)-dimethyltransferase